MYQDQEEYQSPIWGSSPLQCEQDFRGGANSSIYSSPSSSPDGLFYNAGEDLSLFSDSETMDYSQMEAFGSVILPDLPNFGPDDLFPDLVEEPLDIKENFHVHSNHSKKITIKLKKVKRSKQKSEYTVNLNRNNVENLSLHPLNSYSSIEFHQIPLADDHLVNRFEVHDDFSSLLDLASEVHEARLDHPVDSPLDNLSLIDALSKGNDCLLDNILFSDTSPNVQTDACINLPSPSSSYSSDTSPNVQANACINLPSPSSSYSSDDCSISIQGTCSPQSSPNNSDYFSLISSPGSCTSENTSEMSSIEHHPWDYLEGEEMNETSTLECNMVKDQPRLKKGLKLSKEMRYLRKKQQNKEAAIRYRQKKKQEEEDCLRTLDNEHSENRQLKKDFKNLKRELSFMKKLMRETFAAQM